MRVLRISHSANVNAYRERERALRALPGVEIALVCPSDWQHLGQSDEYVSEEFLTLQAKTIGTGSVPLFAYEPGPIVEALKRFRPDVVDIHEEPYSVSGFECLLLAEKFAPRAARVFYSAQNINKRYLVPFRWTEQYVYRHCQGAYPCSIGVQEVLRAKGFKGPCPVIPLGVDPEMFSPNGSLLRDCRLEPNSFVIGFTGRLIESKGLHLILHAIPSLMRQIPSATRVKLVVAGAGPEREKLVEIALGLGLQGSVEWLGELKQSEMSKFYRSCNVIVVPSITTPTWKEQFGRVPVEAMACGVPVIVSDSGSLPEVVDDVGIIVREQDSRELAAALSLLLTDNGLRESLIGKSHALMQEKYTWAAVASAMRRLYQQAITTRHQFADQCVPSLRTD